MSTVGSDIVSTFTVRELTGPKRVLQLRGRALPYRPFELSGEQRNSVDWYPGSPVGTLQVYGAKEGQTTITGAWKDVHLASADFGTAPALLTSTTSEMIDGIEVNGSADDILATARDIVKAADSIRRTGQEVEVRWLDQVRRGIVERFTAKWQTGHDVDWEMMFTWTSQGEDLDDVPMHDDTASDLSDLPNKVQGELGDIVENTSDAVPQSGDRGAELLSDIDDLSSSLSDLGDNLTDAAQSVAGVVTDPATALRRIAGVLDGIKLQADDLALLFSETVDGAALDSAADDLTASLGIVGGLGTGSITNVSSPTRTFGEVLTIRANNRVRSDACIRLRDLAAREQNALLSRISSTVIASFQAREDQDLREVAQVYYGSSDAWRGLMVYNRLTTSRLRAGQVVFVPAQPPSGSC